jgi:hypothetical protein
MENIKLILVLSLLFQYIGIIGPTRCAICSQTTYAQNIPVVYTLPHDEDISAKCWKHVQAINRNKLTANSACFWSYYTDILRCTVNKTLSLFFIVVFCMPEGLSLTASVGKVLSRVFWHKVKWHRSQWPRGLRRGSAAGPLLWFGVWIPSGALVACSLYCLVEVSATAC